MKENLMVQFVYPEYDLPSEYLELIDTVDHIDIKKADSNADVAVFDGSPSPITFREARYSNVVIRLTKNMLIESVENIAKIIAYLPSVNIIITDSETFNGNDLKQYENVLETLSEAVAKKIISGNPANVNLLTVRIGLDSMKNCNAGDESITLAPDGNFYICPAFYSDGEASVGNPREGVNIPNQHLYKLPYAPICRTCDAYHCKRCVWLNQKSTLEVNTPGHEQCVVSHIERNASRSLLKRLIDAGRINPNISIPEIDYLDPFDNLIKQK